MAKLSKKKRLDLGYAILNEVGDAFYEPWEYDDREALPEGHDQWSRAAIKAWWDQKALQAADGALSFFGRKDWDPREER